MAKLRIDVDVNGEAKVKHLDKSLKDLEYSSSGVSKQNKLTSSSITALAAVSVAAVGSIYLIQKAFTATIKSGFEFSKQMEESKAGLQALSLAIQDKNIPLTERMADATKEATVVMAELQKINAKTPHTLDQTNQIYKAMYVSMKNVGASSQEVIDLTQKLSVAAGAAGIEFNSLLAGVDGLATGTVLANSDLGRFLGSLGLTNDELKESTDVVKLLNETLEDFKAIDTITTATSNLGNEWGRLSETVTKDIFVGAKDGMNELSGLMKTMSTEDTENLRKALNGFAIAATTAVLGVTKAVVFLADGFESLGARIAGAAFRIEHGLILNEAETAALEKMYQKTEANIASRKTFITTLETSISTMTSSITTNENKTTAVIKQEEAERILNETVEQGAATLEAAENAELEAIYASEMLGNTKLEEAHATDMATEALSRQIEYYEEAEGVVDSYTAAINSINSAVTGVGTNQVTEYSRVVSANQAWWDSIHPFARLGGTTFEPSGGVDTAMPGFAAGGYTGDIDRGSVAGVVHGKEYVVNAQTTEDLGLNGGSGVFQEMNKKLDHLYEINKTLKRMFIQQKNTHILLTERLA